jgi:hypothetical protein
MIFTTDTAPATGSPVSEDKVWAVPANNATGVNINLNGGLLLSFGNEQAGGITITQQGGLLGTSYALDGQPGAGTVLQGLTVCLSSTATTYTPLGTPNVNLVVRYV